MTSPGSHPLPSSPPPGPALLGRGLSKRFGDVQAITSVDIEVQRGEVVALIGPNGAGKSTLLSLLAGLLKPDAGVAEIEGRTASAPGGVARRQLGFVSGDTKLYERLTPEEVLLLFGRLHGMAEEELRRQVAGLIERFGLGSFARRRCDQLSTGQAQRVNLARALVHDPTLLVLDEPTTALDVASQGFVLDTVERAREEGRAVLFSSHILGEIERVADRVVVLRAGAVLAEGPLADVERQAGGRGLSGFFRTVDDGREAP